MDDERYINVTVPCSEVLSEKLVRLLHLNGESRKALDNKRMVKTILDDIVESYHFGISDINRFVCVMIVVLSQHGLAEYFDEFFFAFGFGKVYEIDIDDLIKLDLLQDDIKNERFSMVELYGVVTSMLNTLRNNDVVNA